VLLRVLRLNLDRVSVDPGRAPVNLGFAQMPFGDRRVRAGLRAPQRLVLVLGRSVRPLTSALFAIPRLSGNIWMVHTFQGSLS
jgi:hypothetical protein